MWNKL